MTRFATPTTASIQRSGKSASRLAKTPTNPQYLLTVKGKGYRLDAVRIFSPQPPPATPPAAVRVLVLPFENKSDDASLDNFCDALADETSANLGMLNPEQISVIARTTAGCYRRTHKSIAEIAHELGLDYILEGSLTRDRGRVRIRAQLVRCFDQTQIWSGSREMMATDALDIQTEVGAALAKEVLPALAEQQRRMLARRLPIDPAPTTPICAADITGPAAFISTRGSPPIMR